MTDSADEPLDRFHRAMSEGDDQRARELLKHHPELTGRSIVAAVVAGALDDVRQHLDADSSLANLSLPLPHDENARIALLYFACVLDHVPIVRLLLERGANPNDGESVYHSAELNHRECLELLLAHDADISGAHAQWGNTPLYFLAGYKEGHEHCASSTLGMQWLLEHGADPNVASYQHGVQGTAELPLHRIAAFGRSSDVARLLVQHGAMVDAPRADGRTAYVLALRSGNADVAEFLAAAGADTHVRDPVDRLLSACMTANEEAARMVLAQHPDLVESLTLEDRNTINLAAEQGRADAVRLMISLGWSVSEQSPWGGTPLHWAAWFGQPQVVRALLSLNAPVNVRDTEHGSSAIGWAAHGSRYSRPGHDDEYCEVAGMLLDAGATREASFNFGEQPPEAMASPAVADLLMRRGFAQP